MLKTTDLLLLRCFRRFHVSRSYNGIVPGPRQVPADGRLDGAEKTLQPVLEFGALLCVCMPNQNRHNPVRTRTSKTKKEIKVRERIGTGRDETGTRTHSMRRTSDCTTTLLSVPFVFVYVHLANTKHITLFTHQKQHFVLNCVRESSCFWHSLCLSASRRWRNLIVFAEVRDVWFWQPASSRTHTACAYQSLSLRLVDFLDISVDVRCIPWPWIIVFGRNVLFVFRFGKLFITIDV